MNTKTKITAGRTIRYISLFFFTLAQVLPRKNERTPTTKSLLVFFGAALHFSEVGSAQAQTVSGFGRKLFFFFRLLASFSLFGKTNEQRDQCTCQRSARDNHRRHRNGDVPRSNATYPYIILMSASFTAVISPLSSFFRISHFITVGFTTIFPFSTEIPFPA